MNIFWDFSTTTSALSPSAPPDLATPVTPPQEKEEAPAEVFAEPDRDEVIDPASRGGQEGESRVEEESGHMGDLSMFTTLTELLFTPFSDGYCKVSRQERRFNAYVVVNLVANDSPLLCSCLSADPILFG